MIGYSSDIFNKENKREEDEKSISMWRRWIHRRTLGQTIKRRRILGPRVDIKEHEYAETQADDFVVGDLRDPRLVEQVVDERMDEIYQLAADMGVLVIYFR